MQLLIYKVKWLTEQHTPVYQPNSQNSIIKLGFVAYHTNFAFFLHFLHYSVLERTISHSGTFCHTSVNKMQNLIFQPSDVIELLLMNIKTYLDGKYTVSHCMMDKAGVDANIYKPTAYTQTPFN